MKPVLVTGAAGYVGSHTCKVLAHSGFEPIGLDSLERAGLRELPWGPLEVVETADTVGVARVLARYRPIAALHFAAYAHVGESTENPAMYYRNNFGGSLALFEALRAAGIGNWVFSSTCATYGVPDVMPIAEDLPQRPVNPYGASKLMVERMLLDCDHAYGVRSVALRYFNAAGADPDCEVGECHEPETHVIPLAIRTALGEQETFGIFGTDYATPDGTAIRDFIHVTDLARAHVMALNYLLDGGGSEAFNLGTGQGHSVRQVLAAVEAVTGREIRHRASPRRAGDPPVLVADPAKVRARLGWAPEIPDLTDIVRTAVEWHRKWRSRSSAPAARVR
jgi:UDP-glucose-4-epimerase GalE